MPEMPEHIGEPAILTRLNNCAVMGNLASFIFALEAPGADLVDVAIAHHLVSATKEWNFYPSGDKKTEEDHLRDHWFSSGGWFGGAGAGFDKVIQRNLIAAGKRVVGTGKNLKTYWVCLGTPKPGPNYTAPRVEWAEGPVDVVMIIFTGDPPDIAVDP